MLDWAGLALPFPQLPDPEAKPDGLEVHAGIVLSPAMNCRFGERLRSLAAIFARPASHQQRPQFSHVIIYTLICGACIPAGFWIGGSRHVDRSGFSDHGLA
jgi:hypothetical protein